MPERHRHWIIRTAGKLLPVSIRTSVFEPAFEDLWRDYVIGGRSARARLTFAAGCVWALLVSVLFGLPRYFREPEGATRLGRASLVLGSGAILVLTMLLMPWLSLLFWTAVGG